MPKPKLVTDNAKRLLVDMDARFLRLQHEMKWSYRDRHPVHFFLVWLMWFQLNIVLKHEAINHEQVLRPGQRSTNKSYESILN